MSMKRLHHLLFALALFLPLSASMALAANTTCANALVLTPDGSEHNEFFAAAGEARWFRFRAEARRSYAVMADNLSDPDVGDPVISATAPQAGCAGGGLPSCTVMAPYDCCTGNSSTEPRSFDGSNGAGRYSVISNTSQVLVFRHQAGASTIGTNMRVRVVETTQVSPLWTTYGGYETFYRLQNTTNSALVAIVVMVTDTGTALVNQSYAIPANMSLTTITTGPTDLNLADNQAGFTLFLHDGPPGALAVDGFTGIFSNDRTISLPITIKPARWAR